MSEFSDSKDVINTLLASQHLGVLATQDSGQPYGNLIAFAVTADMKHIVFATNRNTRKYGNILANNKVAMLVDSRRNEQSDFNTAVALTAIGIAEEATGNEKERLAATYLAKHPPLAEFVNSEESALINITVSDYIIARFNESKRVSLGD
jgi:nitroimidazol reductase NimA-like FMN-containing flavoprotein (pyridoxamine 5'-phosphate oxidase superfamily)